MVWLTAFWHVLGMEPNDESRKSRAGVPRWFALSVVLTFLAPALSQGGSKEYLPVAKLLYVGIQRFHGDWMSVLFITGYVLVYLLVIHAAVRLVVFLGGRFLARK